jgi:hypothetical protein
MPASEARSKPVGLHSRPPEPTSSDHRILLNNGTTMALELRPSRLQQQKEHQPSTLDERFMDLVRQHGVCRRELGYSRGCLKASRQFIEEVSSVGQKLMLCYYHNYEYPLKIMQPYYEHAVILQTAVDKCKGVFIDMEDEWVNAWKHEDEHRDCEQSDLV